MTLVSKSFSEIVTFSRSSNATRVGPTGLVEYAPHNLLTYSEQFDNAAWNKVNATTTANAIAAPNGTVTAESIAASSTSCYAYQAATIGQPTITFSVYAKAGSTDFVAIETYDGTANVRFGFNLVTLATSYQVVVSATNVSASAVSVGNGWVRCSVTFTRTGTSNCTGFVYVSDSISDISVTSGKYAFFWGAQLSVGPYPLDYTPTTSAAVYGPRFDYDPVTLAARGLLVEEQRTNTCTYSEDLTNAAWSKDQGTIASNATTSPDGTVTADKFVESAATAEHRVYQLIAVGVNAVAFSIFAKAAGRNRVLLRESSFSGAYATFDLSSGTVVESGAGGTGTITNLGNGWYRCVMVHTSATARSNNYSIYPLLNSGLNYGDAVYTGDGTSGLFLWGAQLEAGSFATSYIPTLASTVTRSADVASVNTLSPWFNATEGTLFVDSSSSAAGYSAALYTDVNNSITTINGSAGSAFEVIASGSTQASIGTRGLSTRVAGAYKANDFAVSVNGGTVATDTSGTVPSITDRLQLGSFPSLGIPINGHLRRVAYFPRRLQNAELQALTA